MAFDEFGLEYHVQVTGVDAFKADIRQAKKAIEDLRAAKAKPAANAAIAQQAADEKVIKNLEAFKQRADSTTQGIIQRQQARTAAQATKAQSDLAARQRLDEQKLAALKAANQAKQQVAEMAVQRAKMQLDAALARQQAQATKAAQNQGILASIKGVIAGTTSAQNGFKGISNGLTKVQKQLQGLSDTGGNFARTINSAIRIVGVIAALQTAKSLLTELVQESILFNSNMEQARIGIASVISAVADVRTPSGDLADNAERFEIATRAAQQQIEKLRIDALKTAATFEELVEGFQAAVGPGLASGLDLDQVREFVVLASKASSAIGLQRDQLAIETRQILSGDISSRQTRLAQVLRITNEDIKRAKEAGQLFEFLQTKFAAFALAGDKVQESFVGRLSNLRDAFGVVAGAAGKASGLFDGLSLQIKNLTGLLVKVDGDKITPSPQAIAIFRSILNIFSDIVGRAGDFIKTLDAAKIQEIANRIERVAKLIVDFFVGFISGVGKSLLGILEGIESILSGIGASAESVGRFIGFWVIGLGAAKILLGGIADGFIFLLGTVKNITKAVDFLAGTHIQKVLVGAKTLQGVFAAIKAEVLAINITALAGPIGVLAAAVGLLVLAWKQAGAAGEEALGRQLTLIERTIATLLRLLDVLAFTALAIPRLVLLGAAKMLAGLRSAFEAIGSDAAAAGIQKGIEGIRSADAALESLTNNSERYIEGLERAKNGQDALGDSAQKAANRATEAFDRILADIRASAIETDEFRKAVEKLQDQTQELQASGSIFKSSFADPAVTQIVDAVNGLLKERQKILKDLNKETEALAKRELDSRKALAQAKAAVQGNPLGREARSQFRDLLGAEEEISDAISKVSDSLVTATAQRKAIATQTSAEYVEAANKVKLLEDQLESLKKKREEVRGKARDVSGLADAEAALEEAKRKKEAIDASTANKEDALAQDAIENAQFQVELKSKAVDQIVKAIAAVESQIKAEQTLAGVLDQQADAKKRQAEVDVELAKQADIHAKKVLESMRGQQEIQDRTNALELQKARLDSAKESQDFSKLGLDGGAGDFRVNTAIAEAQIAVDEVDAAIFRLATERAASIEALAKSKAEAASLGASEETLAKFDEMEKSINESFDARLATQEEISRLRHADLDTAQGIKDLNLEVIMEDAAKKFNASVKHSGEFMRDEFIHVLDEAASSFGNALADAMLGKAVDFKNVTAQLLAGIAQDIVVQTIRQILAAAAQAAFVQQFSGTVSMAAGAAYTGGNVASAFNNAQGFATGGHVGFRRPDNLNPRDTVPIWADPAEWVIRASSVAKYGSAAMDAINRGLVDPGALRSVVTAPASMPAASAPVVGLAAGGSVSSAVPASASGSGVAVVAPTTESMRRMLHGGRIAMMDFFRSNKAEISSALR